MRLLLLSVFASVAWTGAQAQVADPVILKYQGTLLYGKWGVVGTIQEAIKSALVQCGQPAIDPDGLFGGGTRDGLRRLAGCPGFQSLGLGKGEANDGAITEKVWQALLAGKPLPTVQERAFTAWLMHEATDFDKAEFNFVGNGLPQPNDPSSYLTWGPYGATVGHGHEVQEILKAQSVTPLLSQCFGPETTEISKMLTAADAAAGEIVRQAFIDPARRQAWKTSFACLGAQPAVRTAYDAYAFRSNGWMKPALSRVYQLIPGGMAGGTDTDYAFFVDVVMHMGVSNNLMTTTTQALAQRASALGRPLTAAERRQTIGQTFVAALGNQVEDRRGRNVLYYIDGVGEAALSPAETAAWRQRSGVRASDFGLRDLPFQPNLN